MKQLTSILAVFLLLLLFTCCNSTEQNSGSETSLGLYNSISNSELTVTSEYKAVISGNSSVSSVAKNPYVSQNERGETVYISYAEKFFNTNDEIPEYLKTIDLRQKGFDVIANERIYITPHIINLPKSRAGKTEIINTEISTAEGGGNLLRWSCFGKDNKYLYSITWHTSAKLTSKPINNARELDALIKSYSGNDITTIITHENKYYVLLGSVLYWMYDNKYVIGVSNFIDKGNTDELILLAEDIEFEEHTLK